MNDVYFTCPSCKQYVDAGHRWASDLVGGELVEGDGTLNVDGMLACAEYWKGVSEGECLKDLLPKVHAFLVGHRAHGPIRLGFDEDVLPVADDPAYFDWLMVAGLVEEPSPRLFAEILGLRNWTEVEAWVHRNREPWWWSDAALCRRAQDKFEELMTSGLTTKRFGRDRGE